MLIRQTTLDGIKNGIITLAFRRWKKPTVRKGGSLLTSHGQLEIRNVSRTSTGKITEKDAQRAGFVCVDDLITELQKQNDGLLYRIEFGQLKPDPRKSLRAKTSITRSEMERLHQRLARLDGKTSASAWTIRTLRLIGSNAGKRAAELSAMVGQTREQFKTNVRKLKNLGLTESLETGYRLSPRGRAFLKGTKSK